MKNKSLKKILLIITLAVLTIIEGVCWPMSQALESIKGRDGVFAIMETSSGNIVLELFYKEVPLTVTNFVGLAEGTLDAAKGKPFYDGLKFHRVIADFMIQGGDPLGNGTGGPGYKFPDEFVEGLIFDKPGKLAMANSGANTNGSQFFITHVPTDWLNYKHTIFGEVVEGQSVVDSVKQGDKIEKVFETTNNSDLLFFTNQSSTILLQHLCSRISEYPGRKSPALPFPGRPPGTCPHRGRSRFR